jgi:hypothetical protein
MASLSDDLSGSCSQPLALLNLSYGSGLLSLSLKREKAHGDIVASMQIQLPRPLARSSGRYHGPAKEHRIAAQAESSVKVLGCPRLQVLCQSRTFCISSHH